MTELRPYQNEAVDAVFAEWAGGHKRTLLVLPTGTGKTICFAKVVEKQIRKGNRRALILAHREELLDQASDKIKQTSNLDTALEKAEFSCLGKSNEVVVGSVQTLAQTRRLDLFPSDYFTDIVVDEAHHVLSESYQKVLSHFPDANVLGVTATPDRGDQKNLGTFFDSKAYEYTLKKAVKEGYLSPITARMIPLELDIKNVGISNGDYAVGQIGSALEPYLNQIAKEMLKYCVGRKTIVFLPLVKTSQKFCELLNLYGLRAAEVNGNSTDREQVLRDFENGEYDVLCNSMLLTEGYDCPSIDCVVVLRPTKVRSLYQQMVGRGMRIAPNKTELLLLDFLWMTERHDLCKPSSLISRDEDTAKRVDKKILDIEGGVDLLAAEDEAERDALKEREEALARELEAMRKKKLKLVDPIQYAFSIAAEDLANYEASFGWEAGPATEKQLQCLEHYGIYPDEVPNAGYASLLIDKLRNRQIEGLATPKQIRFLEQKGFVHVGTWEFDAASRMISRIAENGWRVPYGVDASCYRP